MADDKRWHEDDDPEGCGCWIWDGWADARGNPGIHLTEGMRSAARWVWEREYGEPPPDLPLRRICESTLCVNPRHRVPGSRRGLGRQTKLTALSRRAIRSGVAKGLSRREVARAHNVSEATVREIVGTERRQRANN